MPLLHVAPQATDQTNALLQKSGTVIHYSETGEEGGKVFRSTFLVNEEPLS